MTPARVLRVLGRCVLILALAVAIPAGGAKDPPPREEDLRELRARIEKLQKDLAAAEETRGEAADQLRASEKAVSEARRALFELAQRRRTLQGELGVIARRDKEIRAGVGEQEALAGRLLRLQYQQGAPDRLRLALEGRDAAAVARHIAYYGYIQKARAELIGELHRKGDELAALRQDAQARQGELADRSATRPGSRAWSRRSRARSRRKPRRRRRASARRASASIAWPTLRPRPRRSRPSKAASPCRCAAN